MYELVYSDLVLKQLKKLNKELQIRIVTALERSRIRPYSFLKKLVGCPYFRLRVGDYRIIVELFENEMRIFVIELGYRKKNI